MRKLTHQQILQRQQTQMQRPPVPLMAVLDDIRSLHNVGSMFRTADAVGIERVWLCGITGFPPREDITKTALGAEQRVPWEHARHAVEVVRKLKHNGYRIVVVEQTDRSCDYASCRPDGPTCLVVGNEVSGVSEDVVAEADSAVEITMWGVKNSLNASVAFGVVACHFGHSLR